MNKTTDDKEAAEIAYWQSRSTHERMAEATRLSAQAYGIDENEIDKLKMNKTIAFRMKFDSSIGD
jgi:hypothetical protein